MLASLVSPDPVVYLDLWPFMVQVSQKDCVCVCVCVCVCISVCLRMYIIHFECYSFSMYIDQALQCSILGSKVEDIIMILLLCFVIALSLFLQLFIR